MENCRAIVKFGLLVVVMVGGLTAAPNDCPGVPNQANLMECCAMPMFVDMAAYMECNGKYGEQTKRQLESGGPTKGCCIGECVMNATSLYSNGAVEMDGFRKYVMKSVMGDSKWEQLFSDSVDKCAANAAALSKEFTEAAALPPSFDGEMVCHPISGYLMKCLTQELFKSCPDKMKNDDCQKLQDYAQTCNIVPGMF